MATCAQLRAERRKLTTSLACLGRQITWSFEGAEPRGSSNRSAEALRWKQIYMWAKGEMVFGLNEDQISTEILYIYVNICKQCMHVLVPSCRSTAKSARLSAQRRI